MKRRRRLWYRRELIGEFRDRDDLIDGALASAHVPYFLDGRFHKTWRGHKCIDGSFRLLKKRRFLPSNTILVDRDHDPWAFTRYLVGDQHDQKPLHHGGFVLPRGPLTSERVLAWLHTLGDEGYQWADDLLVRDPALLLDYEAPAAE